MRRAPRAALRLALVLLAAAVQLQPARAGCPPITLTYFPDKTENVPAGWTRAAQQAAGNDDTDRLNTIQLAATPAPKLYVQPQHPLFSRKACVPAECLPPGKGRHLHRRAMLSLSSLDATAGFDGWDSVYDIVLDDKRVVSSGSWEAARSTPAVNEAADAAGGEDGWSTSPADDRAGGSGDTLEAGTAELRSAGAPAAAPAAPGVTASAKHSIASGGDWGSTSSSWGGGEDGWGSGGGGGSGSGWGDAPHDSRMLATCLTTVAQPAGYEVLYNIDGGVAKKATMPKEGAPFIQLTNLDTLTPGKHTLNIKVTMLKGTAEVNSISSLQPPADQVFTTKVNFVLGDKAGAVEKEPAAPGAAKPGAKPVVPAPGAKPAAPGQQPAAAEPQPGKSPAPPAEAPEGPAPPAEAEGPAKPTLNLTAIPEAPAINPSVAQQAVKYYCVRQYNVGGRIHSTKSVPANEEGYNQCAVACNALASECSGFGVAGDKCFLMRAFNTSSSTADATIGALCMKSANDWMDFGMQNAAKVAPNYFCLRGYDLKGDPAGSGDAENPVQAANTEVTGMTASTCSATCKTTVGCQFFLMKKPAIPGGTATCYLKMHALGGQYGNTGPSAEVDYTCFNGADAWTTFGGQLEYALPSPEVNTGVATPALAAVATPVGAPPADGTKTYRCIKQYQVNGTVAKLVEVSLGDEGLTQCASKCDAEAGCVAYSTTQSGAAGACTLLKELNFNATGPSPGTYGMCFATIADWNKFGNPDSAGNYCIKQYDFAGDGVRSVDYITITSGAGAVQFCKQQCSAEPQCQYSVTSKGKCYMKNNILSGSFGTTQPDTSVDASCVKGEQNWALAALQVSAAPSARGGAAGAGGLGHDRNTTARRRGAANGAGAPASAAGAAWLLLLASSLLAAWLGGCAVQWH